MFLQRRGFDPTLAAAKNLLLKRFELSSPQATRVDRYILYPFSYSSTLSMIKKIIKTEYNFAVKCCYECYSQDIYYS